VNLFGRLARVALIATTLVSVVDVANAGANAITTQLATGDIAPGGNFHSLPPARAVDTRLGLGSPLGPTTHLTAQLAGAGGVPATGVSSVVINVTTTDTAGPGWLAAYATGTLWGGTSNVNSQPGRAVASMVVAAVGTNGRVDFITSIPADIIVDIEGYFSTTDTATATGLFTPVTPARLMDTRSDPGRTALGEGDTTGLQVSGRVGIPPTGVSAVIINTTVDGPTADGWVTAYPAGFGVPATSTINFSAGQTRANRSIVAVGSNGAIAFQNARGTTHLIVDVTGYFTASGPGSYFVATKPTRLWDTRRDAPNGLSGLTMAIAGGTAPNGIASPIPTWSAITKPTAALMALTTTESKGSGWGRAVPYPPDVNAATTSDLNMTNEDVSNMAATPLGDEGQISFLFQSGVPVFPPSAGPAGANTDWIVDVFGYFALPAPATATGGWGWGDDKDNGNQLTKTDNAPVLIPARVLDHQGIKQLASGDGRSYVLFNDGTLQSWTAAAVLPMPVTELSGVTAISVRGDVAFAIRDDGLLWQRKANSWEQWSLQHTAVAVEAGRYDINNGAIGGLLLMSDGSVGTLGTNPSYGPGSFGTAWRDPVIAIAYGHLARYLLRDDLTVWAEGANSDHQLGDGTTTPSQSVQQVPGLTDVVAIAAADYGDTYALKSDGTLWRWGPSSSIPSQVQAPQGITSIAADRLGGIVVAVLSSGAVWAWQQGPNTFGPLPFLSGMTGAGCGTFDCFAWGP
jgi:alpha-tubulin suppressor-like RCC1 family protein